jgi:hypothetical protein
VVDYGKSMMSWLCNKVAINQQDGILNLHGGRRVKYDSRASHWGYYWGEIVKNYTKRQLTYEKDKLPAISGIVSRFQASADDECLAGLWKSDLMKELLWNVSPTQSARKPEKYRAPSWSWASIEGTIFSIYESAYGYGVHIATVITSEVHIKGEYEFGEVTGGFIKISGPLTKLDEDPPAEWLEDYEPYFYYYFHFPPKQLQTHLWFLGMVALETKTANRVRGLPLVSAGSDNTFSRVGVAHIDMDKSERDETIVTLI